MCSEVRLRSQGIPLSHPAHASLNSMGRLSVVYDEGRTVSSFHAAYQNQAQLPDRKRPQPEPLPIVSAKLVLFWVLTGKVVNDAQSAMVAESRCLPAFHRTFALPRGCIRNFLRGCVGCR